MVVFEVNFPKLSYSYKFMILFCFVQKGSAILIFFAWPGTHADYSKVPSSRIVKIPPEITFEQAATVMIQGMTAHYLVHTTGRVKPGDKVLVHAAAGGTGSLVCQVAKNTGNYMG